MNDTYLDEKINDILKTLGLPILPYTSTEEEQRRILHFILESVYLTGMIDKLKEVSEDLRGG